MTQSPRVVRGRTPASALSMFVVFSTAAVLGARCSSESSLPDAHGGQGGSGGVIVERIGGQGMGGRGSGGFLPGETGGRGMGGSGSGGLLGETGGRGVGGSDGGADADGSGDAGSGGKKGDGGSGGTTDGGGGSGGMSDGGGGEGGVVSFSCGSDICVVGQSFCHATSTSPGGVGGGPYMPPPVYRSCSPFPADCDATRDCTCLCNQVCPQHQAGLYEVCDCSGTPPTSLTCTVLGV